MTDPRRHAPATLRNRQAIAEQLKTALPASGRVLEIASGTGEHVSFFAGLFPRLDWQPSEPDPMLRQSIVAYGQDSGLANLAPPLDLDVTRRPWPVEAVAAILCVNLLHIAPWAVTEALMAGAGEALPPGAPLMIYGPFMREGRHTAESNAAFDRGLRAENPAWGVREMEAVEDLAKQHGLALADVAAMPANNFFLRFERA